MVVDKKSKRDWGLRLIAIWILFNGIPLFVAQGLRLVGIYESYPLVTHDPWFVGIDAGCMIMDILLASPIYILAGILLWRRHLWGLILTIASLVQLTYILCVFAITFTKMGVWNQLPILEDIVFLAVTLPINVIALAYLVHRYTIVHRGDRLA